MNKEELKNIPGLEPEVGVTIWKMNYGFKSDLQGETTGMSMEQGEGEKMSGSAKMDITKLKILNLVYGIFESSVLGISTPKDLGLGLTQVEKDQRIRAIRALDVEAGAFIFKKVGELNKDNKKEVEVIKKK